MKTPIGLKASLPDEPPRIPDHELLCCIGSGSYGKVWLARNVVGTYRAIKVIHRTKFTQERPFEREFDGIKKFEPISRTHPGLVSILHIGRNNPAGYFYCVMEVADDAVSGQTIRHETYVPKTLNSELTKHRRLPLEECLRLSLSLTAALSHLHGQGLVHRDIKPSNIIFVRGIPKFADIGLVTEIGEAATFVGTEGYTPPEGPGQPPADLYSLGKVLYQSATGNELQQFPELPTALEKTDEGLKKLYNVILKACHLSVQKRFHSADQMYDALALICGSELRPSSSFGALAPASLKSPRALCVAILHEAKAQPDEQVVGFLQEALARNDCRVLVDRHAAVGVEWARDLESKIATADAVIVLLSPHSAQSEMIAYEIEMALETQLRNGRPRLLAVRVQLAGQLPSAIASSLNSAALFVWDQPQDNERLVSELIRALKSGAKSPAHADVPKLETVGGAVPLDSAFYIVRPADEEFQSAIAKGDSVVLVKGARQMGKTSLLARGLQEARDEGLKVIFTDFQKLNSTNFESLETFYLALAESLADQLDLEVFPAEVWDRRRGPNATFERYVRNEALGKIPAHLVWGMDEVDRLFACAYSIEVFGLFRSWHNQRALDPHGPWAKLTLAIAYATEAHLFITDLVQSPFNVGTRLVLSDFSVEQVAELNGRYGNPLKSADELARFTRLIGGQPFLVRRGLHELVTHQLALASLEAQADQDQGIFGDHLRRLLLALAKDPALVEVVREILRGGTCPTADYFYRLRSAGLMAGESPSDIRPRCQLYATYLRRHLL